ncbi:MAG: hypothetical protein NTX11_00410 [Candidatus Saccharibacteria bacterium]|nr:hypothetical protein [Candidatus Saccharibacteria bacterium]
MDDENHADTANTLDNVASTQPVVSDAPAPAVNPSTATDSSGNNIILNEGGHNTADISSTQASSNQGPDVIQK